MSHAFDTLSMPFHSQPRHIERHYSWITLPPAAAGIALFDTASASAITRMISTAAFSAVMPAYYAASRQQLRHYAADALRQPSFSPAQPPFYAADFFRRFITPTPADTASCAAASFS